MIRLQHIQDLYKIFLQYPQVQTDTRKLKKDDIYFALKGENFNGNKFAKQAIEKGAAYAVIDEIPEDIELDDKLILVDEVLTTLQALAKYHREQFTIPFIAITGSNGKTTTKELVSSVLSAQYITYTTQGNLNNHIGVPLTLLSIKPNAQMAVVEMGANHQKEIESYCAYTLPTHGLINNCGKAHLEGFGSLEGVRKGKGELYDFLANHQGTAFINANESYLLPMAESVANKVFYGAAKTSIATANIISSLPYLHLQVTANDENKDIKTRLVGDYNIGNVLAAVAVGLHFNISIEKIINAIEQYTPSNSRSQLIVQNSNQIILDAYNANPSSMQAALNNFAAQPHQNKIVLLGAMMEVGSFSNAEHEAIIKQLQTLAFKQVCLVGKPFEALAQAAGFVYFDNALQASEWFKQQHFTNALILVKGSRSMQMEKTIQ